MPAVASHTIPCWGEDGEWLGELQIADRRGNASLETDESGGHLSIGELADYVVLLRGAATCVADFAAPVSSGRFRSGGELFGFLSSQAGLGALRLGLCGHTGTFLWQHPLRIRPAKFRDSVEFETMVSDICAWRTALALDMRAFSSAPWSLTVEASAVPAEERLAVLRAAVERRRLLSALVHVERNATRRLERDANTVPLGAGRFDPHRMAMHLSGAGRRSPVPSSHPLAGRVASLPEHLPSARRVEGFDTPENRFAKLVAESFRTRISDALRSGMDPTTPLGRWAASTTTALDRMLATSFYRTLRSATSLDLGNPALQRRRGYRSLLEAFLDANAGLAIAWTDLDQLVHAETRDVPGLYEIWCLVQLRSALESTFPIILSHGHLHHTGSNMTLRRGSVAVANRPVSISGRTFNLSLWYNRSFSPVSARTVMGYWSVREPGPGTWTKMMKPDYTIELVERVPDARPILIHLDAKYKLRSLNTQADDAAGNKAHAADDIDKMHAYLFGVNDSVGAYILYPGDFISYFRRSDLRSTIGAISVVPGRTEHLCEAIREIVEAAVRDA